MAHDWQSLKGWISPANNKKNEENGVFSFEDLPLMNRCPVLRAGSEIIPLQRMVDAVPLSRLVSSEPTSIYYYQSQSRSSSAPRRRQSKNLKNELRRALVPAFYAKAEISAEKLLRLRKSDRAIIETNEVIFRRDSRINLSPYKEDPELDAHSAIKGPCRTPDRDQSPPRMLSGHLTNPEIVPQSWKSLTDLYKGEFPLEKQSSPESESSSDGSKLPERRPNHFKLPQKTLYETGIAVPRYLRQRKSINEFSVSSAPSQRSKSSRDNSSGSNHISLELSRNDGPRAEILRNLMSGLSGNYSAKMRLHVWETLLFDGKEASCTMKMDASAGGFLPENNDLSMDIERTRPELDLFRTEKVKQIITKVITDYCLSNRLPYRQGMNHLVAPLVALKVEAENYTEQSLVKLFSAIVDRFIPLLKCQGPQFNLVLQSTFSFLRLLLRYHDPELALHLETSNIGLDFFAAPWILTWFSHKWGMAEVLALWDQYLVENDPVLHHCTCIAWIISKRKKLLQAPEDTLLQKIMNEVKNCSPSLDEVIPLVSQAKELRSQTPGTFLQFFRDVCCSNCLSLEGLQKVVPFLESSNTCSISASELAQYVCWIGYRFELLSREEEFLGCNEDILDSFMLLDCRSLEDYAKCNISFSQHFSSSSEEQIIESLQSKALCARVPHICLIGEDMSVPEKCQELSRIANRLMHQGLKHVSILVGGFQACIMDLCHFLCSVKSDELFRKFFFSIFDGSDIQSSFEDATTKVLQMKSWRSSYSTCSPIFEDLGLNISNEIFSGQDSPSAEGADDSLSYLKKLRLFFRPVST